MGDAAGSLDLATGQDVLSAASSGIEAARDACLVLRRAAGRGRHLAEYDDWFSSSALDGADELSAMYHAQGIRFHEVEAASERLAQSCHCGRLA